MTKGVPTGKIRPWDKLQDALPPLSTYEFDELKNSIEQHGVLQKMLVLPDGRIIDGHRRWEITKGKAPCDVLDLDEDSAFTLGVLLNIARRNMAPEQMREARKHIKKLVLALKKANKSQSEISKLLKIPQQTISDWGAEEKGDISNTEVGKTYIPDLRISVPKSEYTRIYERAKAGEAQTQIAADYKISQPRVSQIVKRVEMKLGQQTPELPEGKFDVLLADPPWEYEFSVSSTRDIEGKYPTMSLEEICELKVPNKAADNSILFLWTPMPKLREGLRVLEEWGFEYKTGLVWVKDKIGMGYYARSRHELVLIGTKGEMPPPETERKPDSVITAPRREHSRKPDELYGIIERMYPHGRYLELFARRTRPNWTSWGSEIEN